MEPLIDTHVHVWDLTGGPYGVTYPWLTPDFGPLYATHTLDQVLPDMAGLGVTGLVLVQASDSLAETDELLRVAATSPLPTAVVGWLPLADAAAAERELDPAAPTPGSSAPATSSTTSPIPGLDARAARRRRHGGARGRTASSSTPWPSGPTCSPRCRRSRGATRG